MKDFDDQYKEEAQESADLLQLFGKRSKAEKRAAKLAKLWQQQQPKPKPKANAIANQAKVVAKKMVVFKKGDKVRTTEEITTKLKRVIPKGTVMTVTAPQNKQWVNVTLGATPFVLKATELEPVPAVTTANTFTPFALSGLKSQKKNPVLRTDADFTKKSTLKVAENLFVNYETTGISSKQKVFIEVKPNGSKIGTDTLVQVEIPANTIGTVELSLKDLDITATKQYNVFIYKKEGDTNLNLTTNSKDTKVVQFETMKLRAQPTDAEINLMAYMLFAEGADIDEYRVIRDVVYNRIKLVKNKPTWEASFGAATIDAVLHHKDQFASVRDMATSKQNKTYNDTQTNFQGEGKIANPPDEVVPETIKKINEAIQVASEKAYENNATHGNYVWFWLGSNPPSDDAIKSSKYSPGSGNNFWESTALKAILDKEKKDAEKNKKH